MTLHLWDRAGDPNEWATHHETRPVLCGLRVDYASITRTPENVTCPACEAEHVAHPERPTR